MNDTTNPALYQSPSVTVVREDGTRINPRGLATEMLGQPDRRQTVEEDEPRTLHPALADREPWSGGFAANH